MRIAVCLSLLLAFSSVAESRADETSYYLELGKDVSSEEAVHHWEQLSAKFPKQLGKLQFLPETVIDHNQILTRLQAGPIQDKDKADALCAALFRKDTPCFVIEGLERPSADAVARALARGKTDNAAAKIAAAAPAVAAVSTPAPTLPAIDTTKAEPLPNQPIIAQSTPVENAAKPEIKPAPPPSAPLAEEEKPTPMLPWLRSPNGAAKVEVDEAIRVPLTTAQNDIGEKPAINEVPVPVNAPLPGELKDKQTATAAAEVPGWLEVESFADETQASGFWQNVHNTAPNQAAGLRVRVIRPLESDDEQPHVTLNIGPFPTQGEAMSFCNGAVLPQNSNLQCHFTQNEPEGIAHLLQTYGEHSEHYAARREAMLERRANAGRNSPDHDAPQGQAYWLQVASSDNEVEALELWEDLRTDNADILGNVRSSVSAPSLGGSTAYVVKIGPLSSNEQATDLCKALKGRGISCSIFSNK